MSGPVRPPLTVETLDGTTVGRPITTIKVTNGDLTVSGTTATIDTSGSGSVPGGSDTEIQYNNAGAFGGDAGLKITTKGAGSTTTIRSGNMLLGGAKVATATANGFVSVIADGSGQIFLTSGSDQGGTFTDTQVNIFSNTNTDNAILNFRDSSNTENGRITLKSDGNLEIKNSVTGKNLFFQVTGSAGITIKQDATDTDSTFTVEGNGTGLPKINLTNNTKSVTMLCDENQKLKVQGGTDSFVFDVSSATGGITFPDGTTQSTAASGSTGANPTATVGPTATNGTAVTFMRSDAAPALADTAVTPGSYTYSSITVDQQGRLTAASSGTAPTGTIGGSITEDQVAVGASTANEIEGSSGLTFDSASGRLVVAEKISSQGTNALTLETNSGTSTGKIEILNSGVSNHINITPASGTMNLVGSNIRVGTADTTITTRGAYDLALSTNDGTSSGTLTLKNGTNGNLIFTPNGTGTFQIGDYQFPNSDGSANQVLQTDGAGTLSFADVGGGNTTYGRGSISGTALGTTASTFGMMSVDAGASSRSLSDYNTPGAFPLIAQETGTVDSFTMNIVGAESGIEVLFGFYTSVNGLPNTLIGSGSISTASTGYITQTSFSTSISLTAGETYWIVYGNNNNSTSSASVRRLTTTYGFGVVTTNSDEADVSGYTHSGETTSLPATFTPTSTRFFRPLAYYTVS